jgi:thiol-disulfide isomerase/thioredoxin
MISKHILTSVLLLIGLITATLVRAEQNLFEVPLQTLTEDTVTIEQYVGKKPIYIKFWASWCQDCLKQMPHLQHVYEKYNEEIAVVSVNLGVNETQQAISNVLNEYSLTAPTVIDTTGKLAQGLGLVGTPYHVLLDIDGNIVFKGHDASQQLDNTIRLLASSNSPNLPVVSIEHQLQKTTLKTDHSITALFFTATWCDWYLAESRPLLSKNCIAGQQQINQLSQKATHLNWLGVISHLWTGEKEMDEYREKYQIPYFMMVDSQDQEFVRFNVKDYPTLILLKDGKEIYRTSDFSEPEFLTKTVLNFNAVGE